MLRTAPPALRLVATVLGGCLTAPAIAQHEALNVITVNGTGRILAKPDIVLVKSHSDRSKVNLKRIRGLRRLVVRACSIGDNSRRLPVARPI